MLKVTSLSVAHDKKRLLNQLNFSIKPSEFIAIVGENGCGKSSLMQILAGLSKPKSGIVQLKQKSLSDWSIEELAKIRAIQQQAQELLFDFNVETLLTLGRHSFHEPRTLRDAIIEKICGNVDVQHLLPRKVNQLSGGERQRVFLAKALLQIHTSQDPNAEQPYKDKLLLLDEPTSALDFKHQTTVIGSIKALCEQGLTAVCISHDINLIAPFVDKILLLANQGCIAFGEATTVLTETNLEQCYGIKPQLLRRPPLPPLVVHSHQTT